MSEIDTRTEAIAAPMGDLKPCPFCGGEARLRIDTAHSTAFLIGCATIGCFGHEQWEETEADAIAAWNRRTTQPEVTALVEALGKIAEEVSYLPGFDRDPEPTRAAKVAREALAKWEAAQK